jgi:ABC-2 type transport system permease protein
MNKTWLVLKHEYLRHVKRKRFILAVLSMPLMVILMVGIGVLVATLSFDNKPVGYLDQSGILSQPLIPDLDSPAPFRKPIKFLAYKNEKVGREALETDQIQAFFIIPSDYLDTGQVQLISQKSPDSNVINPFREFLVINLLRDFSPQISDRIMSGATIEFRATEDKRIMNENNLLGIILPFLAGLMFLLAINLTGGYLLQAVVEEKENRTMEIIVTSISPTQLMTGKVIGNLSVGLTQLIVWLLFGGVGVGYLMHLYPELQITQIDTSFLLIMVLTFLPAFVMVASMMATLGATATEAREAQQIAGIFTIPIAIPFWFAGLLIENPNSPFAIFLSIFPFTAATSLPLRAAFTNIPIWQLSLTILLLITFAIAALWLAGRAFRLGMLRYGKRLSLKDLFQKA